MSSRLPRFVIAANRGELGGGEEMLLRLADAARTLGLPTLVVAPESPDEVARAAAEAGHDVVALPGHDRLRYLRTLRSWDRSRGADPLWCNGLLPATATAGHRDRVVHLHQTPPGLQRWARRLATAGVRATVVPSESMGRTVPHDIVLPNWTADLDRLAARPPAAGRHVVGYLGRLQTDKGVDVLASAVEQLTTSGHDVQLVVAGDDGFADVADRRRVGAALDRLGDRVVRLGRVPREEFFSRVDLAVFPSVWPEPFGLVVAEAMGFGVPFVVSDAGALPEVAGPDQPWVARAGDAADLARVIGSALSEDTDARAREVDRARGRWEREFSPAAGRARFADVLRRTGYDVRAGIPEGAP